MRGAIVQELLDQLIAPIASHPVEIGIILYIRAEGGLAGMRHVRGHYVGVELHLRRMIADALAFDARGAIMAHNHPSGDHEASRADIALTRRLSRAFETIGVRLLDHIVLAGNGRTSLRAAGRL